MCANSQSEYLTKLVEYLILNNVNVINNGLYHGKMGIAICLCEYARYVNDDTYLDLAGDLLDEIFSEMDMDVPANFQNGVCGIGWGIEYLIQQKYMSGNSDEILEEFDARVMQIDINRITDFSIETGLGGIALYIITRMTSVNRTMGDVIPFDLIYLGNWMHLLPIYLSKNECENYSLDIFTKLSNLLHDLPNIHKEQLSFPAFISLGNLKETSCSSLSLIPKGLDGGIAGIALQMMRV